ncbi:hypothetical protein [Salegentibacter sp. Hel_I_6]|uniref:hypothetical protein n=1 Tax=Salegentibacter sp. Hel_I_6 TaxID=1250278 RepID=UPI0005600398|nr:hypothetical protein [Salegentibacter sp. Hel_I_6]
MIIYYQKKRLNYKLYTGIGFLIIGIAIALLNNFSLIYYTWILLGLLQLATWYYEKKHQYLYITEDSLTKNSLFRKSIKLNELTAIWKLRTSFTLQTKKNKIKIDKDLIEDESLNKLTDFLNQIELNP